MSAQTPDQATGPCAYWQDGQHLFTDVAHMSTNYTYEVRVSRLQEEKDGAWFRAKRCACGTFVLSTKGDPR